MDAFNIPKMVNRHVYKAVSTLQNSLPGFVSAELINKHVRQQMRGRKNQDNLDEYISQSLSNLTTLGVLACTGSSHYAIRHTIRYSPDRHSPLANSGTRMDPLVSNRRERVKPKPTLGFNRTRLGRPAKRTIGTTAKQRRQRRRSIMCIGCRLAVQTMVKICQVFTAKSITVDAIQAMSNAVVPIVKTVGSQTVAVQHTDTELNPEFAPLEVESMDESDSFYS